MLRRILRRFLKVGIGHLQVMLLRNGGGVPDPVAHDVHRMLCRQFRLPGRPQVVEQLRPGDQPGAFDDPLEWELRNAVYAGPWTADAKRYFSKTGCPAYGLASDYLRGSPIRQEYLETAVAWHADGTIEEYMSKHQHDKNATPLWHYFQSVIGWVKATFPKYRREMKGVAWGDLYNRFQGKPFDTDKLEKQIAQLMVDEDVERKPGIYPYVLDGDERHLNIRAFSDNMKREAYER